MTTATTTAQPLGHKHIVTTTMLRELIAQGKKVRIRGLASTAMAADTTGELDGYAADVPREVVAVNPIGDKEVQCIEVSNPDHLYVSDGGIVTHNTSNIIYLKSTDDSMIETLSKMSGTTHRVYRDSKTVTKDLEKLMLQVEGKISYTSTAKEEAVISYNDLAYLPERNSIVFRAGDLPIWNRNETILPMSWRLFKNTIKHYGHPEYTLQTIPTLSTAIDFDVRQNQPDFGLMLQTRLEQAEQVERAADTFAQAYGYSALDIERLDPDVYADEVFDIVRMLLGDATMVTKNDDDSGDDEHHQEDDYYNDPNYDPAGNFDDGYGSYDDDPQSDGAQQQAKKHEDNDAQRAAKAEKMMKSATENTEVTNAAANLERERREGDLKRYAHNTIARNDIYDPTSGPQYTYDKELVAAFIELRGPLSTDGMFVVGDDGLYSPKGEAYIVKNTEISASQLAREKQALQEASEDAQGRVHVEDPEQIKSSLDSGVVGEYGVTDHFRKYLISLDSWDQIAGGRFDDEVYRAVKRFEAESGNHYDDNEGN